MINIFGKKNSKNDTIDQEVIIEENMKLKPQILWNF